MPPDKIIAGLIGTGRIGRMHAANILAHLPQVSLKAVADCNPDDNWVRSVGIHDCYDDHQTLLKDTDIEAVVISTPSSTHVEMIKDAAGAGKHIFCEKPIAFEADLVAGAVEAAKKAGVILQVGFNRRFDPEFRAVKAAVESGKIGQPHIIRITNRDPERPRLEFIPQSGGLFMDFSTHDMDMVRFLGGSEVAEVYATGSVLVDPKIGELGDIDTAVVTLRLENGTLCVIDMSRETNYGYDQQVEVFGSKGSVSAVNTTPTKVVLSTADRVLSDKPYYSFVERYVEAYVAEMRSFFEAVASGSTPKVTGHDAIAAVQLAQSAQRSFETNRPVRIPK
jgi:myo-inositol 2-dehydrogenase/D-chiro-inositol 1-dehydrogenase